MIKWVMVCFFVNSPTEIIMEPMTQHETISKCHMATTLHEMNNKSLNQCVCVEAEEG